MSPTTRITILSSDSQLSSNIQLRLHSKGCQATVMLCDATALGIMYADPPDLIIADISTERACAVSIIASLRNDSFFSTIPIIGMLSLCDKDELDWEHCLLDDFVFLPLKFDELFSRIALARSRLKRILDNNPLTRLPGNTSIQMAIEEAIGTDSAVCYLDINHFKPYNDAYGFAHGDEVIRMTARIMFNTVRDSGGGFCGHIGGDDFVCIVPLQQAEAVCQTIIEHFDIIAQELFDEDTKRRGYYFGTNRKGENENIPILSVSIGIVPLNVAKLQHSAMISEIAAELKKLAKDSHKSCFVIDKRAS